MDARVNKCEGGCGQWVSNDSGYCMDCRPPTTGAMPLVWNVAVRDEHGGVRAEFAIYAGTLAGALREAAPNLVDYRDMCAVEITRGAVA